MKVHRTVLSEHSSEDLTSEEEDFLKAFVSKFENETFSDLENDKTL